MVAAGGKETALVDALVRAYPRAVAGPITSYAYDATLRQGALVYRAAAGGITEIAAPGRLYPEGIAGQLSGVAGCVDTTTDGLVVLTSEDGTASLTFGPE